MNWGCSSFSWETQDGFHLLGRTYDQFGDLKLNQLIAVPAGACCSPGLNCDEGTVTASYGYTGMAVLGFGHPIQVDGVNYAGPSRPTSGLVTGAILQCGRGGKGHATYLPVK